MRKETRLALGVVGLSALTTSYLLGHQSSESSLALGASAAQSTTTVAPDETATPDGGTQVTSPAESATATSEATATPETTASSTPSATKTSTPSATATPTETATATPTQASSDGTYKSSTVQYRYGRIQLEVTVANGALTDINLLQATTTGRGYDQAPPILVQAALDAGGTNFGNLSGATFTTQAFKQALTEALNKAGL